MGMDMDMMDMNAFAVTREMDMGDMNDPDHGMGDHGDHMESSDEGSGSTENSSGASNLAQGGMNHMNGDHAMMSPFLFTRTTDFFVLFSGANIGSTGGFIGALLLSGLFAMVATVVSQLARVQEGRALMKGGGAKLVGGVAFGLRTALHYFAMLIVMTMNVWLIIAVVIGHVLGWLLYAFVLYRGKGLAQDEAMKAGDGKGAACDC